MPIICPLCGSTGASQFLPMPGFIYLKCPSCSLVFLDLNTKVEEKDRYTMEYIQKRGHDQLESRIVKAKEETARHYFSLAEQFVPKGDLLEVGCSTGIMLKVARQRGWQVHGVEINSSAAAIAAESLGVSTITDKELSDELFPGKLFSLIALFDVIEHIPEPIAFMNAIKKKLAPNGIVLFVTPDIKSLSFNLLKSKWPHLMPEHPRLYSRQSMDILFWKTGLKAVKYGWAGKHVTAEILRRHLACHPHILFSKTAQAILKNTPLLNEAVFPFNLGELYAIARIS